MALDGVVQRASRTGAPEKTMSATACEKATVTAGYAGVCGLRPGGTAPQLLDEQPLRAVLVEQRGQPDGPLGRRDRAVGLAHPGHLRRLQQVLQETPHGVAVGAPGGDAPLPGTHAGDGTRAEVGQRHDRHVARVGLR